MKAVKKPLELLKMENIWNETNTQEVIDSRLDIV